MKRLSGATKRVVMRLALALVTIIVAGLFAPTGGSRARLTHALDAASRAETNLERRSVPSRHHLRDGTERVALGTDEAELDDDDSFFHASSHAPATSPRIQTPRRPDGMRSGVLARDPSRFAIATDLARGPPA